MKFQPMAYSLSNLFYSFYDKTSIELEFSKFFKIKILNPKTSKFFINFMIWNSPNIIKHIK